MDAKDIIEQYLFVTAGACGPCRFGTYVTEYRKALRDAGFEGFRVMLFQQQGGLKQATGEELGLEINQDFILSIVKSMLAGDVLNLMSYRMRPYERELGSIDAVIAECHKIMVNTFQNGKSIVRGLFKCRQRLSQVAID
jgi:predicted nucleotide-binding protein (sugar kinase/HSP70/actin superfamily)